MASGFRRLTIARRGQFFLEFQLLVGRHGRPAPRRHVFYGRITACFRAADVSARASISEGGPFRCIAQVYLRSKARVARVVTDIRKPKVDRPLAVAYSPQLSLFKIVRLGRRI
jgi:hypothetical protein